MLHRVEARRFPHDPFRCPQCSARKDFATRCTMREFETLANTAEDYCVLADNIAFSNCLNLYFILVLLARLQHLYDTFSLAALGILFRLVLRLVDLVIEIR